jgi:hypothetical protein
MGLSEQLAAFKAEFARIAPILLTLAILRRGARLPLPPGARALSLPCSGACPSCC